jgi:Tfp pilus assembly protein PilN
MIKVNLLRNVGLAKSTEAGGTSPTGVGGMSAEPLASDIQKAAGIKLAVILAFPLTLLVYEKIAINDISTRVKEIQEKIEVLKQERVKFGDAAPKIEKYNKEKQRIDKELEIVRGISQGRLRELKTLDAIQSLMPNKTWSRKIAFKGGVVVLEGYSDGDDGVTELIRALEGNVLFSKVELKFTTSESGSETGGGGSSLKRFEIEFRIGKQE